MTTMMKVQTRRRRQHKNGNDRSRQVGFQPLLLPLLLKLVAVVFASTTTTSPSTASLKSGVPGWRQPNTGTSLLSSFVVPPSTNTALRYTILQRQSRKQHHYDLHCTYRPPSNVENNNNTNNAVFASFSTSSSSSSQSKRIAISHLIQHGPNNHGKQKRPVGQADPALELQLNLHGQNITVVLVGCLHGSSSSALDVRRAIRGKEVHEIEEERTTTISTTTDHHQQQQDKDREQEKKRQKKTDVVVLELCATRFADLRRDVLKRRERQRQSELVAERRVDDTNEKEQNDKEGSTVFPLKRTTTNRKNIQLFHWLEGLITKKQTKGRSKPRQGGVATNIAAVILGGTSGLQTALSGFEPGLEFITAWEEAQVLSCEQNEEEYKTNGSDGCHIILADRTVDETLYRLGSLPRISLEMFRDLLFSKRGILNCEDSWYGIESRNLFHAVWGDLQLVSFSDTDEKRKKCQQVDMGKVLTRSHEARLDLLRLTLPPLLLIEAFSMGMRTVVDCFTSLVNNGKAMLDSSPLLLYGDYSIFQVITDSLNTFSIEDWSNLALLLVSDVTLSCVVFAMGYMALVLPATRVIISERDDQLARGIRAACKIAAEASISGADAPASYRNQNESSGAFALFDESQREEERRRNNNGGRVVAVLGLLHVNGVARRLLSERSKDEASSLQ